MKIVIIGGTGLIGSKTVERLRAKSHEVVAASPSQGINSVTGEGLVEALRDCDVVVDVANSPSFEADAVLAFFNASASNLATAEKAQGVRHHVALSIVGVDRVAGNGYFRAKVAQEAIIKASGIPYTIVRATQFMEFLTGIAYTGTEDPVVTLSTASLQPIASDDVADAIAEAALAAPLNGIREIAGPERFPLNEIVARHLAATGDARRVVGAPEAGYFGAPLEQGTLVSDDNPWLGKLTYETWFARQTQRVA